MPTLKKATGQLTAASLNRVVVNPANNEGLTPPTFTVAQLATMTDAKWDGTVVRCSNGNAGAACLAVRQGGSWLRVVFGAAVAVT
jgi:hypothetical protein